MSSSPKTLLTVLAAMVMSVVGAVSIHQAFAGPTSAPPYNNVAPPVNQSGNPQVKSGPLGLGSQLTTAQLGSNQLTVKGQTTIVGDTYSNQFCITGKGCANDWDAYCKANDTRSGCQGVSNTGAPAGTWCGIFGFDLQNRVATTYQKCGTLMAPSGAIPRDQDLVLKLCPVEYKAIALSLLASTTTTTDLASMIGEELNIVNINKFFLGGKYTCVKQ